MNSIYWLIALAVLLVIEIITLGLTTIWFAGGALIALLISMVTDNLILEFVAFLVVSLALLIFTRPVAAKYFNKGRAKTNYDLLIGKETKVTKKIDNFNSTGQVIINGQEWTARAMKEDDIIEPGMRVVVREISGIKLIVDMKEED